MYEICERQVGQERICEQILCNLPDWFGIEESLRQYVQDTLRYPTWLAFEQDHPAGFITVHQHFPSSAEIHCMAVDPNYHRRGVGRALIEFVETRARAAGTRYLQVKTQGASRPCKAYERTRAFYEAIGFVPLEEFHTLWEGNPCLLLVKALFTE